MYIIIYSLYRAGNINSNSVHGRQNSSSFTKNSLSHTLKQPHTSVMTSGKQDNGPVDGKFMDACIVSVPQNPCLTSHRSTKVKYQQTTQI